MHKQRFRSLAKIFPLKKILVVGDVMLDEFLFGEVSRISPEAPVPVVEILKETFRLGGAANVAQNIRALGGHPVLLGIVGDDSESEKILAELRSQQMETRGLLHSAKRKTTKKTRIIAGPQQVCRADREDRRPLADEEERQIGRAVEDWINRCDGVVVSDYAKGLISPPVFRKVASACKQHKKFLIVDPKIKNFSFYRDATVITPNHAEAEIAAQLDICDDTSLARAGERLLQITRAQAILITRGKNGMSLFERGKKARHLATMAMEVFDVTGAGDSVVATLALAVASGASLADAADVANHAAGIVVGKLGTASASVEEIARSL